MLKQDQKKLIIYIIFVVVTLAVYWQVHQFDFVFDDVVYVTENHYIQSGITLEGIRWSFSSTYADFWHPLTWLSLMFDYHLYKLNAGGYHVTNLILHILNTLLLFWLFCRMTNEIWKSAFVAAFFALHPMHVESVAWVSERKDVLSAFFWMITLCCYVYYSEKPAFRRYVPVVFTYVMALLSKPMVVTLPVIMILLDYWPLKRFQNHKGFSNILLWQIKEKLFFFVLSGVFSVITIYAQYGHSGRYHQIPPCSRLANAIISFATYLEKTFWPQNMAAFYPFSSQIPVLNIIIVSALIIAISTIVIVMAKRMPYLFTGWFLYMITILPVIGIIQIADFSMADRYHYLPSIGIAIIMAWLIPSLLQRKNPNKIILYMTAITFLIMMFLFARHQCSYWKNSMLLWDHALKVTKNNYFAYTNRGNAYYKMGRYELTIQDCTQAIKIESNIVNAYNNRGNAYYQLGLFQLALKDYDEALRLKSNDARTYFNKGNVYHKTGQYKMAIAHYNKAINLKPRYAEAFHARGNTFNTVGQYQQAIDDCHKAIYLNPDLTEAYINLGIIYGKLKKYELAIDQFNKAIHRKPNSAEALNNRAFAYLLQGKDELACEDAKKACNLGICSTLNIERKKENCF